MKRDAITKSPCHLGALSGILYSHRCDADRKAVTQNPCYDEPPKALKKPPLGVMPAEIWREQMGLLVRDRQRDLARAIHEYLSEDLSPKQEWINELNDLLNQPLKLLPKA